MKNLIILLITIVVISCSSTKHVVKKVPKELDEIGTKTTPEVVETPVKVEVQEEQEVVIKVEDPIEVEEPIETVEIEIEEAQQPETIIVSPEIFNHDLWNDLLKKHVSEAGNVNYKGFKINRKSLTNYITSLGKNMPNNDWSKEDKLAYWINAYNAMTVDLIIRNHPIKSIKDIKNPWDQRLWKLNKKWYNLNEIEHKILRKMNEPRIHFGIVCASFSCPKLQNEAFTASQLEDQLTTATKEFLSDSKRNTISENNLKLSKIFKWFGSDFENEGSLIDFIDKYSDVLISKKTRKSFRDYNWALNE